MVLNKRNSILVLALIVAVLVSFLKPGTSVSTKNPIYKIIYVNLQPPTSFDPLDADKYMNLKPMRMLYATPLEVTTNNILTSTVLDAFTYNKAEQVMKWVVKSNLKYSDNTELNVDDVVFSVLRMLAARPTFPVLNKIEGINEWLSEKNKYNTLPSGIVVTNNEISFKFSGKIQNPMFRFVLELFSIIPKKCVDLATNKLICRTPPQSGMYNLARLDDKSVSFELRKTTNSDLNTTAPKNIIFNYKTADELNKAPIDLDQHTVITGSDFRVIVDAPNFWSHLTKTHVVKKMPASSYAFLLLNHNQHPFFQSKDCRFKFANEFRNNFQAEMGGLFNLDRSFFPKLLPGYLSNEILLEDTNVKKTSCTLIKDSKPIKWAINKQIANSWYPKVLKKTFENLGIKNNEMLVVDNFSDLETLFIKNEISMIYLASAFWAQDPVGDLKMLFTPNMHELLNDAYSNLELRERLANIDENVELNSHIKQQMEEFNKYLYSDATVNAYAHTQTFYASSKESLLKDLPQAVTAPAPWQLFNVEN